MKAMAPSSSHLLYLLRLALQPLWQGILPPRCALCGVRGQFVCSHCLDKCCEQLPLSPHACCARCAHPLREDGCCPDCAIALFAFERVVTLGSYAGDLKELVERFKYRNQWPLADALAARLVPRIVGVGYPDVVVPIPADAARCAVRGYNQAHLLASRIAVRLGVPHCPSWLTRLEGNRGETQTCLTIQERYLRSYHLFVASTNNLLRGRHVLLVDDVMTTGATLHAAASVLRAQGATVFCAVLARQILRKEAPSMPRQGSKTDVYDGHLPLGT